MYANRKQKMMRLSAKSVLKWLLAMVLLQVMTFCSFKLYITMAMFDQPQRPTLHSTIRSLLQPDLSGLRQMRLEKPQILKRFMLPYELYQTEKNAHEGNNFLPGNDQGPNKIPENLPFVDIASGENLHPDRRHNLSSRGYQKHHFDSAVYNYPEKRKQDIQISGQIVGHGQVRDLGSVSGDFSVRNKLPYKDLNPRQNSQNFHRGITPSTEDTTESEKAKEDIDSSIKKTTSTDKVGQFAHMPPIDDHHGTCTYQNCPQGKSDALNIHLIPHSHIDVGWRQTVDEYYYADSKGVRNILLSAIRSLLKDPRRRFLFVEMAYFSRFWKSLSKRKQRQIRSLIKERRLELVNGGWVMSDTGVTTYNDIIDQHTLGFDFIKKTFGTCAQSKAAWHVDQFGHSREHASLLSQMGYDSLFIGRIDDLDITERKRSRRLEFIWDTSPKNLRKKTMLFTSIMYHGYYTPSEIPIGPVEETSSQKEESIVTTAFVNTVHQWAESFRTNHILFSVSCDFCYSESKMFYDDMDDLIAAVREQTQGKVNVFYSTPSCYTYEVNKAKKYFTVKEDDFMPYAQEEGIYWTGYFTSRPGLKMHIRRAGQILQACKQLSIFSNLSHSFDLVDVLRNAMAIMQHHDAVTGTQPEIVRDDYNRILSDGTHSCEVAMATAYNVLLRSNMIGLPQDLSLPVSHFCYNLNISQCNFLAEDKTNEFLVNLYSPLSWTVDTWVRIPTNSTRADITNGSGYLVPHEMFPVPDGIRRIPERSVNFEYEIVFVARLAPMATTSFKIKLSAGPSEYVKEIITRRGYMLIENEYLALKFSKTTGLLTSINHKTSGINRFLSQDFSYYSPIPEDWSSSGHYIFRPDHYKTNVMRGDTPTVSLSARKGRLVQEVHQRFSSECSQVVRLYKGAKYAEFQWVVQTPRGNQGSEIISRFSSDIKNKGVFYTDSNGREMMQRKKDVRPIGDFESENNVSGNYYPVTSRMFIRDEIEKLQLTLVTDRSQGGSSLYEGSMELMVHRKTTRGDNKGVDEALWESGIDKQDIIYTGKHYLHFGRFEESAYEVKHLAMQVLFAPTIMFSRISQVPDVKLNAPRTQIFLAEPLPPNVQVLSLDQISADEQGLLLLRLEHVFEVGEHSQLSQPVEVALQLMFEPFVILAAEETSLGGNFYPSNFTRLRWRTQDTVTLSKLGSFDYKPHMKSPFVVRLEPMEIRTFRVQTERRI